MSKTMSKTKTSSLHTRLLITMLGIAFVAYGSSNVMLGYFGEKETATITHIGREEGERDQLTRGKYTYNISYTFTLPNGRTVNGISKKVGDATYLKVDGKSKTAVRYFSFLPIVNAMEEDTKPDIGQVLLLVIGCFLIYIVNRRKNNLV